jgi:hypothetical protein
MKATLPLGVPGIPVVRATVAVSVTDVPTTTVLALDVRDVPVVAGLTVSVKLWVAFGLAPLEAVKVIG